MAERDSIEKGGESPDAKTVVAALDLHRPTSAAKLQAAKDLANSDDRMVKANVLPPLPDFPKPESLDSGSQTKTLDANQRVVSETVTLAKSPTGSTDLKAVTQHDPSGVITSRETTWIDAKGKRHDVVEFGGVTSNTVVDGSQTDKLITRADGSWEHDLNTPGKEVITRFDKDRVVSVTERDLKKGESHESVNHPNGFTEDIVTKKGFKESQTRDSAGVLRFDSIVAAQTADGKSEYHLNKRLDQKGNVLSDDSHWRDKAGIYHEDDTLNFGDRTKIRTVTVGDTTNSTTTKPDGTVQKVIIKTDGTNIDPSTGETRPPNALDRHGR